MNRWLVSATRWHLPALWLLLVILPTIPAVPLRATVAPQAEPLQALVRAPAGFVATPAPRPLAAVETELSAATRAAVDAFHAAAGPEWSFYVDRRSGAMALVEGSGLPWITSGTASLAQLEAKARQLMAAHPQLFGVAGSQLVLEPRASRNFGETGQFWQIAFRQVVGGVPVEASRVVFRVSHGNLVQFGVNRVAPGLAAAAPALSAAQAKAALATFLGGLVSGDQFVQNGMLGWVLRGTGDEVGYTGPLGAGWEPALVYRFLFTRPGSLGTWLALVDAGNGAVLRFVDANEYASVAKGSALTRTNCTDPGDCVPGTATELPVTMPNAKVDFVGGTCAGNGCYSNSAGAFAYPPGALSATTSLQGKYFLTTDVCGPILAPGVAPGNIDLGASDPLANVATDCAPASRESAPGTGPVFGGPGDTRAARTMFYHLNLINQKSRFYLPHNDWLKGADGGSVVPNLITNAPPACNALWSGGINSLVFMRITPGLGCNNTGEVPDVALHEFGHALDQYDGTGTAPESATGEAMGDTFALLQGQQACFGPGFRLKSPIADPNWGNTAGYGDSASRRCTGVRELDYTKFCNYGTDPDCVAAVDPDAPNGSRSGLNPPAAPADAGTPARWNHMIDTAPAGAADGLSNFYDCGGPETTGCAGPLNHGCHCESLIASQSNWDLAKRLIADEFGGDVYADPPGPAEVSGWQYMDRLWYLTRDLAVSGYSVTGFYPEGTTNGCTATDWFSTYRFIDDDNGNLADGTPHADILFAAFDLHGIACGAAAAPENQGAGCPAPLAAPTVATCGGKAPVQLQWTPAPGATGTTRTRVLRNTLGCGFGFTPVAEVAGTGTFFEDSEVAPGVTYYYSVQPVGQNPSCYGQVSNCVAVTPAACSAATTAPPTGVTLATPAANQVQVSWTGVAGAGSYKVSRKAGDCASTVPFTAVGVVAGTSFLDAGLQGGNLYSYQVASAAGICASCASAPSSCVTVRTTGSCSNPPVFAGVQKVTTSGEGSCQLTASWQPATSRCGSSILTYDVFRSTDPDFVPAAANRVAAGVSGTSWTDDGVASGTRYFYVVRASDGLAAETNGVKRWEIPVGSLTPGAFTDDAGDTTAAKFRPSPGPGNAWAVRANGTNNATRQYATTAAGNYPSNACQGLESDTVFLGANPALTFRSRYDMETGWDGGYVEVATEGSGFSNWTKLDTVNYPLVMAGPAGDPACGGPGFADGAPVFTGTSPLDQWGSFSASLSAYANQRIRLRFRFSSDGSTEQGGWFVDDIQVTNALLPGPCSESCGVLDDSDPAIEYAAGFYRKRDPAATRGFYHLRGGAQNPKPGLRPAARLVFQGDGIGYQFALSKAGGVADVFIDGVLRESISQLGSTDAPAFGQVRTYRNLGPGPHEIRVENRNRTTYVDGFEVFCVRPGDGADPAAVRYRTEQETTAGNLGVGGMVEQKLAIGPRDREVFVQVEGGSLPLTLRLLGPLGNVLMTSGRQLSSLTNFTSLDAVTPVPGTYRIQVLNPPGGLARPVEVTTVRTVEVP